MMKDINYGKSNKYGKLEILEEIPKVGTGLKVKCLCDCGNIKYIELYTILKGDTQSCGCFRKERAENLNKTHGKTKSTEYRIYTNMKQRCINPNHTYFEHYGGRGITICDRWLGEDGFKNFLDDMGQRPSFEHTLDRIENDKGYYKENCRWATDLEQSNNKRNNVFLTYNGKTDTISNFARLYNIDIGILRKRLFSFNWTIEEALTKCLHSKKNSIINDEMVREIRRIYKDNPKIPHKNLVEKFKINLSTLRGIIYNSRWKHVI